MPIRYPATGNIVWTSIDASSQVTIIDELAAALVAAGWTDEARAASVTLTFTGVPTNNQTCTFDGVAYTFKDSINNANAREVLIGATAADCAQNLLDCINDTGSGEGTTYSSATAAHATCTAAIVGAAVTVADNVTGASDMTASEALSNATLSSTAFIGGGHWLTCAKTARGLQCKVIVRDGANAAAVYFASVDELAMSSAFGLASSGGRVLQVYACAHQFFVCLAGSSTTAGTCVMGGVPYVRDAHAAPVIASVSDSGGEFLVATSTPHGLVTGSHVFISGATKDAGDILTALNGDFSVTVTGLSAYTLDGSVYEAGYDANSAVAGGAGQLSRAIWAKGQLYNADNYSFRKSLGETAGYATPEFYVTNESAYSSFSSALYFMAGVLLLPVAILRGTVYGGDVIVEPLNFGGYADLVEARIAWPPGAYDGERYVMGELWGAFVVNVAVTMDVVKDNFDGHNWINYTNNWHPGSLWLATATVA